MIRIPILSKEKESQLADISSIREAEKTGLEALINQENVNWLTEALQKTEIFRVAKEYNEATKDQNWSKIKPAFMKVQASKCAYCEQKLEDKPIQHDVEHFRPKKNVRVWLTKTRKQKLGFDFVDEKSKGYYLLPYNIFNYVTACKQCNTVHKSDCFPVAGNRINDEDDFEKLQTELPFLIYPLGNIDENPEDLISFNGYLPSINPQQTDQHKRRRALVTIEFFQLAIRESLIKQRAEVIKNIYEAFLIVNREAELLANNIVPAAFIDQKKADLERSQNAKSEHTNCARSFFKLCFDNPALAKEFYDEANKYIETHPNQ